VNADKLPDGWTRVRLGEVITRTSKRCTPEVSPGVRWIGADHLDEGDLSVRRWSTTDDPMFPPTFYFSVPSDSVLLHSRNPKKVAILPFDAITGEKLFCLAPVDASALDSRFLAYQLQSDHFHEFVGRWLSGSVNKFLNWTALARYEFALPPIEEQQRIVEILVASGAVEQAEHKAFVASVSEVSALLRSMTEVGEPTTLGALAGGGIQIGPFGSQLHVSDYALDGVPVLMPADLRQRGLDTSAIRYVGESKAQELSSHRLREGDIVLPRRGELDKRAIISAAEVGWLCGTGSVRVRLQDPTLAPLVLEVLASRESVQWLSENAVGTTMPNINRDIVARIPLRLPPQECRELWVRRLTAARAVSVALMDSVVRSARRTAALREALLEVDRVQ